MAKGRLDSGWGKRVSQSREDPAPKALPMPGVRGLSPSLESEPRRRKPDTVGATAGTAGSQSWALPPTPVLTLALALRLLLLSASETHGANLPTQGEYLPPRKLAK